MDHACSCGGHGHAPLTLTSPPLSADQTVGDVVRRPGALEVMERFGLNHCCGAHLTLREAAAAAGVSVDELLRALSAA